MRRLLTPQPGLAMLHKLTRLTMQPLQFLLRQMIVWQLWLREKAPALLVLSRQQHLPLL